MILYGSAVYAHSTGKVMQMQPSWHAAVSPNMRWGGSARDLEYENTFRTNQAMFEDSRYGTLYIPNLGMPCSRYAAPNTSKPFGFAILRCPKQNLGV